MPMTSQYFHAFRVHRAVIYHASIHQTCPSTEAHGFIGLTLIFSCLCPILFGKVPSCWFAGLETRKCYSSISRAASYVELCSRIDIIGSFFGRRCWSFCCVCSVWDVIRSYVLLCDWEQTQARGYTNCYGASCSAKQELLAYGKCLRSRLGQQSSPTFTHPPSSCLSPSHHHNRPQAFQSFFNSIPRLIKVYR